MTVPSYPPRKGHGTLHGITRQEKDERTIAELRQQVADLTQKLAAAMEVRP